MAAEPHIVVLGGGFGGLTFAKALKRAPVRITLVDRRNHHLFQPLLYQVATAALAPGDIAEPIRHIFKRQKNVSVRLAEATGIDTENKVVHLSDGDLSYDTLVVATGARHHYFGNEDWEAHAPGLKTLGDALQIRQRILEAFEQAEWATDLVERRRLLTFVVVGAGPTGVELAGAVKEIATRTLRREFRTFEPEQAVRVVLVEGTPKVLGTYNDRLSARACTQLQGLGVELKLGEQVVDVHEGGVTLKDGTIDAHTVLWAAGVAASPLGKLLGAPTDRAGRVQVAADLSLPDHPEVFVIGDLAHVVQDGKPVPGVAPAAIQMAKAVAASVRADLRGRARKPFRYRDLGSMATIGRSRAIADFGVVELWGFPAWLAWVFVHLMTLVGHRNRMVVFVKWAWAWFTSEGSSRLVWRAGEGRPMPPHAQAESEVA